MALNTWKIRRTTMPKALEEADKASDFQGADVLKLKPFFNELLFVESVAFFLTFAAALVEALSIKG